MKKKFFMFTSCCAILALLIGLKIHSFADPNSLKLEYIFTNTVKGNAQGSIELSSSDSSNSGDYDIYWANANGKLDEYDKITSLKISGNEKKSYSFLSLNAIPSEATKIVATQNNTIKAEYSIPSNKLISDNKQYSFGALSDMHIDGDGDDEAHSQEDVKKEFEYFKSKNVKFVANSGDITRDGRDGDVKAVVEKIKSAGFPVYTAAGNHDNNDPCRGKWSEIEPNGKTFEITVNNDVFVFMGMNKYDFKDTFSSEQISQLSNILEKNKDKRVFLFEHVFFGSTGNVNGLYPYEGLSDSGTAGQFKELMKKYKNVISFTGHTHLEFDLQRAGEYANVKDKSDYGYRVHIPSASRPRKNDKAQKSSDTYNNYEGAMGYLIDVYDNYIVLKGRDFSSGKNLPYATYILYTGDIASSGTTPETTPGNTNQPETTPQATPDVTPVNTYQPEATPQVTPTITPVNTYQPEATPQATPSITPVNTYQPETTNITTYNSDTSSSADIATSSNESMLTSSNDSSLTSSNNSQKQKIDDVPATGNNNTLLICMICLSLFSLVAIVILFKKIKRTPND